MLETINKNQVNVILNKNTDEIATLIEKHRNTMIIALSLLIIAIPLYLVTLVILIISSISILKSII